INTGVVAVFNPPLPLKSLKKGYLYRFFELCGKYSLELYISHVAVRRIFLRQHFKYNYFGHNWNKWGVLNYALVVFWSIVAVAIFTWAQEGFKVTFQKKN
ncbi:MAG: hypothetical protein Q4E53_08955, partial [Eubacteriales bacterium]|nr:hypothetical protein [Eubacteriales bacterium]